MDKVEEKKYIFAIGRRKSSTAEVRLYRKDTVWGGATIKKGECVVNGKPALEYFGKSFEKTYKQPFQITGTENKFAVSIKVSGGGKMGQLDAAVLAIARALVEYEPKLRKVFTDYDRLLLVADVRRKEVRKPNDSKARAARQKSYR